MVLFSTSYLANIFSTQLPCKYSLPWREYSWPQGPDGSPDIKINEIIQKARRIFRRLCHTTTDKHWEYYEFWPLNLLRTSLEERKSLPRASDSYLVYLLGKSLSISWASYYYLHFPSWKICGSRPGSQTYLPLREEVVPPPPMAGAAYSCFSSKRCGANCSENQPN